MTPIKKKYICKNIFPILFLMFLVGTLTFSTKIDKNFPKITYEDLKYLPSGKFVKGMSLGFDEMLSDLFWIKALAYFGGHAATDQDYTWLGHILNLVTTLDPYFHDPYEFGGIVLANEVENVDQSTRLLKEGMINVPKDHPRYWYLPFFIAFNYMYHKVDYLTAAQYLEQASKFPKSPKYLPYLVSRLYADSNSPEAAVIFLTEMIKSTKDENLERRLSMRLHDVIHESNLKLLNQAVDSFYAKFQRYPSSIKELVHFDIISDIPIDPRGGSYYISSSDHSVKNTIKAQVLKVYKKTKAQETKTSITPLPMRVPEN